MYGIELATVVFRPGIRFELASDRTVRCRHAPEPASFTMDLIFGSKTNLGISPR